MTGGLPHYSRDRVKFLQLTLQGLKAIARRNFHILQVRCIVQVEKLPPSDSAKFIGERSGRFTLPVVEEAFRECIPKGFDHAPMLWEHDNTITMARLLFYAALAIASCGKFAGLVAIRCALSWEIRCGCSNLSEQKQTVKKVQHDS